MVDPAWRDIPFTADKLVHNMDGPFIVDGKPRVVDISVIQPAAGISIYSSEYRPTWSLLEQHKYIIKVTEKYPDRLIGCFIFNPHFGVEAGLKVMEKLVKKHGFGMIKLHPQLHDYRPDLADHFTHPILEKAVKLKIPVLIHTGDPPYGVPVLLAPLVESFPDAKIIIAHLGTQMISYAWEAIYLAKKNDNLFLETGWAPCQKRLKEAVNAVGPERVVFGTDTPAQEVGTWLRMVEVLCWDPPIGVNLSVEDREKIFGDNMAKLLGVGRHKKIKNRRR